MRGIVGVRLAIALISMLIIGGCEGGGLSYQERTVSSSINESSGSTPQLRIEKLIVDEQTLTLEWELSATASYLEFSLKSAEVGPLINHLLPPSYQRYHVAIPTGHALDELTAELTAHLPRGRLHIAQPLIDRTSDSRNIPKDVSADHDTDTT